jgi:hypothetical protein
MVLIQAVLKDVTVSTSCGKSNVEKPTWKVYRISLNSQGANIQFPSSVSIEYIVS